MVLREAVGRKAWGLSASTEPPGAGARGLALAPPPVGVEFVDHARAGELRLSRGCGSCPSCTGGLSCSATATRERPAVQRSVASSLGASLERDELPAAVVHLAAAQGVRTPASELPHREAIQRSFGRHAVDDVSAHVGETAAASAQAMQASAFTSGNHVVFERSPDLRTAAHEAAHVVQQRSQPAIPEGVGRVGDAWERQADDAADAVVAGRSAERILDAGAARTGARGRAADGPPVQRIWDSVKKWGGRAVGGLFGLGAGALALAAAPVLGLIGGAYKGYQMAAGDSEGAWGVAKGVVGGIAGAVVGAAAGALSPLIGAVYGGVKGAQYAEGQGVGEQILGGVGGGLAGALAPFVGGAVAGASLMDRVTQDPASDETKRRVADLAGRYGMTLDDPSGGAGPWLEDELVGIEQALGVYEAILTNRTTPRSLAMAADQGLRPWNLQQKHVRRVPHNTGWYDPTNAYASPDNGISVCGDSLLKRFGGPVFSAEMQKGIFIHELGHALLSHERMPFQQDVDRWLAANGGGRQNFWGFVPSARPHEPTARMKRTSGDIEYPITAYGGATPDEDMCETLRFYFQNAETRATLKARAPARFHAIERIVRENMTAIQSGPRANNIHYTQESGERAEVSVKAADLRRIQRQIDGLRPGIAAAQGVVAAAQATSDAVDRRQGVRAWAAPSAEQRAARETLRQAKAQLGALERSRDAMQKRLDAINTGNQGRLQFAQPVQNDVLSGYTDSKHSAAQFLHSLPA